MAELEQDRFLVEHADRDAAPLGGSHDCAGHQAVGVALGEAEDGGLHLVAEGEVRLALISR